MQRQTRKYIRWCKSCTNSTLEKYKSLEDYLKQSDKHFHLFHRMIITEILDKLRSVIENVSIVLLEFGEVHRYCCDDIPVM